MSYISLFCHRTYINKPMSHIQTNAIIINITTLKDRLPKNGRDQVKCCNGWTPRASWLVQCKTYITILSNYANQHSQFTHFSGRSPWHALSKRSKWRVIMARGYLARSRSPLSTPCAQGVDSIYSDIYSDIGWGSESLCLNVTFMRTHV